jgi:hypothetical protein
VPQAQGVAPLNITRMITIELLRMIYNEHDLVFWYRDNCLCKCSGVGRVDPLAVFASTAALPCCCLSCFL